MADIDAADLTHEEWFALWALFGTRPGAELKDVAEWQRRSLGLPRAQQLALIQAGLHQLIARGALEQEKDANGNPVLDPETKQPVWRGTGRIVTRVKEHHSAVGRN